MPNQDYLNGEENWIGSENIMEFLDETLLGE